MAHGAQVWRGVSRRITHTWRREGHPLGGDAPAARGGGGGGGSPRTVRDGARMVHCRMAVVYSTVLYGTARVLVLAQGLRCDATTTCTVLHLPGCVARCLGSKLRDRADGDINCLCENEAVNSFVLAETA